MKTERLNQTKKKRSKKRVKLLLWWVSVETAVWCYFSLNVLFGFLLRYAYDKVWLNRLPSKKIEIITNGENMDLYDSCLEQKADYATAFYECRDELKRTRRR